MSRAIIVRFTLAEKDKARLRAYAKRHYGHTRIRNLLRDSGINILYAVSDDERDREKRSLRD